MGLLPTLFSVSGLAVELHRDRRYVARVLRSVPPDAELKGQPRWRLESVLAAIAKQERRGGSNPQQQLMVDEIEDLVAN